MHHLDANDKEGEKAKCVLHKNAAYCFEQILEATRHKISASYLSSDKPFS